MNRVLMSAVVSLAVVIGVMVNTQQVLSADQAVVMKDLGLCGLFFETEDGVVVGGLGEFAMQLENDNKIMMKCKGKGLANPTGQSQVFEGFSCGMSTPDGRFIVTEDTHATVSATGVGTMTCTFDK